MSGEGGRAPISLSAPRAEGSRIVVDVDPGGAARYVADRELWFDYGELDVSGVPAPVATLPAVGTLLQVAVAAGVDLEVPTVDADFARAVPAIVDFVRDMYPRLPASGGRLRTAEEEVPAHGDADGVVLLYSGGVDSVVSLLRNRDDIRCLVSAWGADVELEDDELWDELATVRHQAPAEAGTPTVDVRTNMRAALDELRLNRHFDHVFDGPDWWGGIQHGVALTTLFVPVADVLGAGRVMIASSHSVGFDEPWGSKPDLDELVRWSGGGVSHDSYDLNRQEKFDEVLAPWLADGNELPLAVCYQPDRGSEGLNCLRCEKCLRSASNLIAAGADPARAALPVASQTLADWRDGLEEGRTPLARSKVYQWSMIGRRAKAQREHPSGDPARDDYLGWLADFDFRSTHIPRTPPDGVGLLPWWRYRALRVAHRLPYRVRRPLRERFG